MNLIETTSTLSPSVAVSTRTAENLKQSIAPATLAAYRSNLKTYSAWLNFGGLSADLPHQPETVADYASHLDEQGRAVSTIESHLQAISWFHRVSGFESPTKSQIVRTNKQGLMRGRVQDNRPTTATSKAPATVDVLRAMVGHCDTTTINGVRDKALLLVGFSAALRRSELVALQVDDVSVTGQGADIKIRSSKTDQHGKGELITIRQGNA